MNGLEKITERNGKVEKVVSIKWIDHTGETGWTNIHEYSSEPSVVNSWGKVIYEDDKVITIIQSIVEGTCKCRRQADAILIVLKSCIEEITSY